MDYFGYRQGSLFAEDVDVSALAEEYGTPLYVYSRSHLKEQYAKLVDVLKEVEPTICYSVKCNSTLGVLQTFQSLGAGADIVSGGELFRALRAGFRAEQIAFAGVGKTAEEIEFAIREGILYFTVESEPELERISACAQKLGKTACIAMRVNPAVDPQTHRYTSTGKGESKFGVDLVRAERAFASAAALPGLEIAGLHMHIGSPIMVVEPYADALDKIKPLCRKLKQLYPTFRHLDIGGGLGIKYRPEDEHFNLEAFADIVIPAVKDLDLHLAMEPGRFLTGNAGILVTRVHYVKDNPFKKFIIVDAAMNDLLRPPLYEAYHEVRAVKATDRHVFGDVVGPICESGDFLAFERELPAVEPGDLLSVMNAGAYGFAMASNYNSRPRSAEVMVERGHHALIRARETVEDLTRGERGFE